MAVGTYNVQCINGHAYVAPPGSELEKLARDHVKSGVLDALMVSPDECVECSYDSQERDRRFRSMCDEVGCALDDGEQCRSYGCRSGGN